MLVTPARPMLNRYDPPVVVRPSHLRPVMPVSAAEPDPQEQARSRFLKHLDETRASARPGKGQHLNISA